MKFVQGLFYKFWQNFLACFSGVNLLWHALAIALTYVIVTSGFDWKYHQLLGHGLIFNLFFPAAIFGFLVPVVVPAVLLIKGQRNPKILNTAFALIQGEFLGWLISACYKAVTGRVHPELFVSQTADISRVFHFGFMRGGIFWGWPSSHTAVAFAGSFVILALYRESRLMKILAVLYAIYIGLGVSISIHWFSDFVAGAIMGTIIGITVGKSFKKRLESLNS